MMTMTLRIALILVSVGTLLLMMRRIRQSKMQIESAVFWIVLVLVLVVFSLFPAVADLAAHCLGIYSTANFLFLFAIFEGVLYDDPHLPIGDEDPGTGAADGSR